MFVERVKFIEDELENIGATKFARDIARKKGQILRFKISDLSVSAALILKQEAISVGGDFIAPKELILGEKKEYCGILIATEQQLEKLIKKCQIQPFGLKKVGEILRGHLDSASNSVLGMQFRTCKNFQASTDSSLVESLKIFTNTKATPQSLPLRFCESQNLVENQAKIAESTLDSAESQNLIAKYHKSPQIMGIINITDDSFFAESRTQNIDEILQKIEAMIAQGVEIIDIGAASTRPDSAEVEAEVELARLKEPLQAFFNAGLTQKAIFSLDSYNFKCAEFALTQGFQIINDVYGLRDIRLAELAKNSDKKIVLMHNSWLFPHSQDIVRSVDEFFSQKIEMLEKMGIKREQIILDVGFGFGKNSAENLRLTQNLRHFKHFGCEILMGASMKRTIGEITGKDTDERLFGTLALHQIALDNGADIIRCHDFSAHIDMLKMWVALNERF